MLVQDYFIYVTKQGDGTISFKEDGITKEVIIPKSNTVAIEIFNKYYLMLSKFKYRYYAIVKWIVRDIRKAGYDFKYYKNNKTLLKPVKRESKEETPLSFKLTKQEELYWLLHELDLINQKLYFNSIENDTEQFIYK